MTKQDHMDPDRALALVSERFHELETRWDEGSFRTSALLELRSFMSGFENNGDTRLSRLADAATLITTALSLQRFCQVMVPFERLCKSVSVTDPDFLVTNADSEERQHPPIPVRVVLDDIRSAFNVGSVLRTADCMGLAAVHLCGYTATPENPRVARAALGAESHLDWSSGITADTLSALKKEAVHIVALETSPSAVSLDDWVPEFPLALVLGNERFGLPPEIIDAADTVLSIPVYGTKNSLNVAVALAIAARECRRHWQTRAST